MYKNVIKINFVLCPTNGKMKDDDLACSFVSLIEFLYIIIYIQYLLTKEQSLHGDT